MRGMSVIYIDPIALKTAAENAGVENANQLSSKTGVNYRTCYRIYELGEVLNVEFKILLGFCEGLLVAPVTLLKHSRELKYGEFIYPK
jgi:hypothetical protein